MNKLKTNSKKVLSVFLAVLMCVTVMVVATPSQAAEESQSCSKCGSTMVKVGDLNPPQFGQDGNQWWRCPNCGNLYNQIFSAPKDTAAPIATITLDGTILRNENVYLSEGVNEVSLYDIFDYVAEDSTEKGSGVNYISYYLSDKALTEDELKAVADDDWARICEGTTGGNIVKTFSMEYQEGKVTYICLKLADVAGNVRYTISPAIYFDTHESKTHHDAVSATCSKEGNEEYYTCDVCGQVFDAEFNEIEAVPVIAKNDVHNFTGAVVNNNDGTHSFKCKDCGVAVGGTVSCDDTYGERVVVDESRPTAAGQKGKVTQTCSVCGYVKETEVDRADYTEYDAVRGELAAIFNGQDITPEARVQIYETVNPLLVSENLVVDEQAIVDEATEALKAVLNDIKTNKDKYYKKYTVTFMNEGEVLAEVTVFSGDAAVYEGEQPTKAADADNHYAFANWDNKFDCVRADITVNAVFASEAHKGGVATCTDKAVCEVCSVAYGDVDANNHVGETKVVGVKDNNCKEAGYTGDTVCTSCGATLTKGEAIPVESDKHVFTTEWTQVSPADCVNAEVLANDCSLCGAHVEKTGKKATGHKFGAAWKIIAEETCSAEGVREKVCQNCNGALEGGKIVETYKNITPCFCHSNHVLGKVMRLVCTILSFLFRKEIKCCNDMRFFFTDDIGSLT